MAGGGDDVVVGGTLRRHLGGVDSTEHPAAVEAVGERVPAGRGVDGRMRLIEAVTAFDTSEETLESATPSTRSSSRPSTPRRPLLKRMVASGRIGRKADRGFYEYGKVGAAA